MSLVHIEPSIPSGSVVLPPSKSVAHRALICSFLAGGGTVNGVIESNDMKATINALHSLKSNEKEINCLESGSAVRFLIPVASALNKDVTFVGEGSLLTRPLDEFIKLLPQHSVEVKSDGALPFSVKGQLRAGNFEIAGDVSSQYITGLLFALPLLSGDSAVYITTPLQSKPYVDMTIDVMKQYGVNVFETDFGYLVKGNQTYKQIDFDVEGDWSQAAFFMALGAIGSDVTIKGVNNNSYQGDKEIVNIMREFGADVTVDSDFVRCKKNKLSGITIDATNIPDMVPSLAVVGAFANGKTVINGVKRLRYKESDRLKTVSNNLRLMGVSLEEKEDSLTIFGSRSINGAELKGYNDHRIVMAFSVAATYATSPSTIDDSESINKSYPSFFEDFNKLGGKICRQ